MVDSPMRISSVLTSTSISSHPGGIPSAESSAPHRPETWIVWVNRSVSRYRGLGLSGISRGTSKARTRTRPSRHSRVIRIDWAEGCTSQAWSARRRASASTWVVGVGTRVGEGGPDRVRNQSAMPTAPPGGRGIPLRHLRRLPPIEAEPRSAPHSSRGGSGSRRSDPAGPRAQGEGGRQGDGRVGHAGRGVEHLIPQLVGLVSPVRARSAEALRGADPLHVPEEQADTVGILEDPEAWGRSIIVARSSHHIRL